MDVAGGMDGAGSVPPAWPELLLLLLVGAECKEVTHPYVGKLRNHILPLNLFCISIRNWLAFASSLLFPSSFNSPLQLFGYGNFY